MESFLFMMNTGDQPPLDIECVNKMKATKENKLPFDITIYDNEDQLVTNRHNGRSVKLSPIQIAVYDSIKGSEFTLQEKDFESVTDESEAKETIRKGIDWFKTYYPNIYYILLD